MNWYRWPMGNYKRFLSENSEVPRKWVRFFTQLRNWKGVALTTWFTFTQLWHGRGTFLPHSCVRFKLRFFLQHHLMEILNALFQNWMRKPLCLKNKIYNIHKSPKQVSYVFIQNWKEKALSFIRQHKPKLDDKCDG